MTNDADADPIGSGTARYLSADELEQRARSVLHPAAFDRIAGGADDESTVTGNLAGWRRYRLRPRVLAGTTEVDLRRTVFGVELAAPLFMPPIGVQGLAHEAAEAGTAGATGRLGLGFGCSTPSTLSLEEVAEVAGPARWFQLYVQRDRDITADLIARAEAAGYRALLLTVDTPITSLRRRDLRNAYRTLGGVRRGNFERYPNWAGRTEGVQPGDSDPYYDATLTWADLARIRSLTTLPLVVKGILTAEDARLAVEHGADGVYVSNHGGRQLGRVVPTAHALAEVAAAVGGRATVLVDGGVREPADVVTALALGADAVGVGRPALWALAAGGPPAVESYFTELVAGLRRTLVLLVRPRVDDLDPTVIATLTGSTVTPSHEEDT